MPTRLIRPEPNDTTRERILKAAILRFSAHSYEATGLRDIAGDVGIDMAYVHRCFGSKEKLFHEAVKAALKPGRVFVADADELPSTLARDILTDKGENEILPLDIVVHSFSSPDASRALRTILTEDFIAPLIGKFDDLPVRSAGLIAALLLGIGVLRDVVRAQELIENDDGRLDTEISRVIRCLLDGDTDSEERPPADGPSSQTTQ